jgi:hypothetical protein
MTKPKAAAKPSSAKVKDDLAARIREWFDHLVKHGEHAGGTIAPSNERTNVIVDHKPEAKSQET